MTEENEQYIAAENPYYRAHGVIGNTGSGEQDKPVLPPVIGAVVTRDPSKPCPTCGGDYFFGHPDSVLLWDHDDRDEPCTTRDYVDGRAAGDMSLLSSGYDRRYATNEELTLMKYVLGRNVGVETVVILAGHGVYRYQFEEN